MKHIPLVTDNECRPNRFNVAATLLAFLPILAACSTSPTSDERAAEVARAEAGMALFRRGCIATKARVGDSLKFFRSQGLTERSAPIANANSVYATDLSKLATLATFSGPGFDGRACVLILDNISQPTAAGAWYTTSRSYFGEEIKGYPRGIHRGGQLPRFKTDGSFETITFDTGTNIDTGNPAMIISYVIGKTTLPLEKRASGRLLPEASEIGTKPR